MISALWAAVCAAGCAQTPISSGSDDTDSTSRCVAAAARLPNDPQAYPATGALIMRPFGSAVLVCTGTLVAPRVVITAAHCVTRISKERLEFTLNHDVATAPKAASASVRRTFVNPEFNLRAKGSLHDIALIELDRPLGSPACERILSPAQAPALLRSGVSVELVGYGGGVPGGARLGQKAVTRANLTSVRADEVTIGGPDEPQSCEGDSGGPAFLVDASGVRRLAAVASRSANDATECLDGSVHTRVDAYATWLTEGLAAAEADERRAASPWRRGCTAAGPLGERSRGPGSRVALLAPIVSLGRRRGPARRRKCSPARPLTKPKSRRPRE